MAAIHERQLNHVNASTSTSRDLHRGRRIALQVGLVVAITTTAVMLALHWPLAWVPAVLVAIIVCVYFATSSIDWHTRRERPLPPKLPAESRDEVVADKRSTVSVKVILTVGAALGAVAIVLAASFFAQPLLGLGALVFLMLLIFFGLPVWVAAVQEEADVEQRRLTDDDVAKRP